MFSASLLPLRLEKASHRSQLCGRGFPSLYTVDSARHVYGIQREHHTLYDAPSAADYRADLLQAADIVLRVTPCSVAQLMLDELVQETQLSGLRGRP